MDTSKHIFQLHGVGDAEVPVLRRKLRRKDMIAFFEKLAPTRLAIEACGASHHWARLLGGFGHKVQLIAPQRVKPYVKRGKNDAIDAAAICEAMSRPSMRFVPVKSAERQAALMLLSARDLLVEQRTMLINAMRGHAAEFGVIAAKGPIRLAELLQRVHSEAAGVPALAREVVSMMARQIDALNTELRALEARLLAFHRADGAPPSRPDPRHRSIGAVLLTLKTLAAPEAFRSGRQFAAWIGLTPRTTPRPARCALA
jgi:transposase